jgi:hypothetical protein
MKRPISTGKCHACNGTFSKNVMTRHLKSCLAEAAPAADAPAKQPPLKTFHLLVDGRYAPDYWLHLEVPAAAALETLDHFLRRIWLECCGHMSAFAIGGVRYSVSPIQDRFFGGPPEQSMRRKLYDVLSPGLTFEHEYDFGTTTHLRLKVVAERQRLSGDTDIAVLARNDPPPIVCESCGQPATQVCSGCIWNAPAWFCKKCGKDHECGEEMFLPVVNSPRVGMCGYTG